MPRWLHWFLRSRFSGFTLVALLLLAWQEGSMHRLLDPIFIPPVSDIWGAWVDSMRSGALREPVESTLQRFAVGYGLAIVAGVTVGTLLGYWRTMYALFEPLVELLRPLPPPATIPVFILFLGIDDRMKITVIVVSASFSILVNTMHGVRSTDPVLLDTARTFGYHGPTVVWRVVLPAALPAIFAGMRISLAVSLIVTVLAEMLAGNSGMGFFVLNAQRSFQIPQMYAGIFTLAVIGYGLNRAFLEIERVTLRWHIERHGTE